LAEREIFTVRDDSRSSRVRRGMPRLYLALFPNQRYQRQQR